MGGGYYDRSYEEVKPVQNSSKPAPSSSKAAAAALTLGWNDPIHPKADPKGRSVTCSIGQTPIILCSDMTGSMGDWPRVIFDKMPVFAGQMVMQGHVTAPVFAFAGIGDIIRGKGKPFQITEFGEGKACDDLLKQIGKTSGAGDLSGHEAYELAAFYFASRIRFPTLKAPSKPILMMFVDEFFKEQIRPCDVEQFLGVSIEKAMDSYEIFRRLCSKYELFVLQKPAVDWQFKGPHTNRKEIELNTRSCRRNNMKLPSYQPKEKAGNASMTNEVRLQWEKAVGVHRVLHFDDPKACVDVMLGAIALSRRTRNLETYLAELKKRDQGAQRIAMVRKALLPYATHEGFLKPLPAKPTPGAVDPAAASVAAMGKALFTGAVEGADVSDSDDDGPT